jgi:hypothetical protein
MFGTVDSSLAHDTMTSAEEQISICIRTMMKCVEGVTVHGDGHTRGKHGVFIEDMPVGVVVRSRHGERYDAQDVSTPSFLYTLESSIRTELPMKQVRNDEENGDGEVHLMGAPTIGDEGRVGTVTIWIMETPTLFN